MPERYNSRLISNARELRKNMTKQERHLWYDFLRGYPVRFYRQRIIGSYIADFYCAKAALVIELDGSQHYALSGQQYDAVRDEFLREYGVEILRFPNNAINENFEGVCLMIDEAVKKRTAPKAPLSRGAVGEAD